MILSDIDWGDDSAERDQHLLEYFVASASFRRLAEGRSWLVVGRKGSGKSALLRRLEEHYAALRDTHVVKVTPKFNTLRTILNDKDLQSSFGEEIFFQHTWLRQFMLDFLCKVGHEARGTYSAGSEDFARRVARDQNQTSKDFVENITEILKALKLKVGDLGEFGLNLESELRETTNIEALRHHVDELCRAGAKFVVMVDDLDLGWDNSDTANNLLLGLLSACVSIGGISQNIQPLVFLREDVYTLLLARTQHSDKYRDVERIRWSQEQLISILEERINFNRVRDGERVLDDAFASVFPLTIGTSNTDNWIVERTLSRPRELIQLSRYYTQSVDSEEPDDEKLKATEPEYSSWKLEDLCAEYQNQYPGLSAIMSHWKTKFFRHKYHLTRAEIDDMVLDILESVPIDEPWFNKLVDETDTHGLIAVLYEIGFLGDFVLGGEGGSRTYYSFLEYHEPLFEEVQVHPCFRRAVNTVTRIRAKSGGGA